jgi:hypothetical protein
MFFSGLVTGPLPSLLILEPADFVRDEPAAVPARRNLCGTSQVHASHPQRSGVMDARRVARKQVAALLQRFFAQLTASLSSGTAELWYKVEARLAQKPPASGPAPDPEPHVPPGALRMRMQPQPMQQQQAKTKSDDETK